MRAAIARALQAGGRDEVAAAAQAASAVAEMVGAMALARAAGEGEDALAILTATREAIMARLVAAP
jgi:TetR/AcrR family transcriptional repressor of nem operon